MTKQRIVCFGPGPQFKGGLSNFNTSLAKTFAKQGYEVHIISWSQQYPAIIPREFIDKSSANNLLEDTTIQVRYLLNYNNPFTWRHAANEIIKLNPDLVVIQWAIALQGVQLSILAKKLKQAGIRFIFDCHFVIQKEASKLDNYLTKNTLQIADEYITHAPMTSQELIATFPEQSFSIDKKEEGKKRIIELYHPVYNIFKPNPQFDIQAFKDKHELKKHVFLFFGFIRKYKGLHNTIRAFKQLENQRDDVSLLICGESFWNTVDETKFINKFKKSVFGFLKRIFLSTKKDKEDYRPLDLIDELQVKNVVLFNEFIPNEDVHQYFQASDATVLFYDNSSPSGVESLSYNFGKPILATNVGHFPDSIIESVNGYLAEANDIESMVKTMERLINEPIAPKQIENHVKEISWENYVEAILN